MKKLLLTFIAEKLVIYDNKRYFINMTRALFSIIALISLVLPLINFYKQTKNTETIPIAVSNILVFINLVSVLVGFLGFQLWIYRMKKTDDDVTTSRFYVASHLSLMISTIGEWIMIKIYLGWTLYMIVMFIADISDVPIEIFNFNYMNGLYVPVLSEKNRILCYFCSDQLGTAPNSFPTMLIFYLLSLTIGIILQWVCKVMSEGINILFAIYNKMCEISDNCQLKLDNSTESE